MFILKSLMYFFNRLNGRSLLAFAGMAGPLVLIATDFSAAFSDPKYNLVRDSISSLALTPFGWIQTIGFLAIGLLVEIFTAGLLFNVKRARGFHLGIGVLVFFGFGLLLIGAFRTDPVGGARTVEGAIHGFTARTSFSIFPVAILLMAPSLKNDPDWRSIYRYSIITAILAFILVILLAILSDIGWFGLLERILVFNLIIWVEVAAVRLLIISLRRGASQGGTAAG
jgi:hypothetical protein